MEIDALIGLLHYTILLKRLQYYDSISIGSEHITNDIVERLCDSRLVILESNHDEQRLMSNPKYSLALKKRILGNNGHLSNKTTARVLCTLAQHNVKQVLLAHLSEENNTPELCYKTVTDILYQNGVVPQENIKIDIARPNGLGKIFVVK